MTRFNTLVLRLPLLAAILCIVSSSGAMATVYLGAEIETNDTPTTATLLNGSDVKITGNISPIGDVDYYSFKANSGDRVYAAVMTSSSGSLNSDSLLAVIASDGVTELESDNDDGIFATASSSIAGTVIPTSGTYYLRVTQNPGNAQLRPYDLWLRVRSGAPAPEIEPNDSTNMAQTLPVSGWVSGNTTSTSDADYYSISLKAGDTVFLSLDLDPERDNVEWNGQMGFGFFDGEILLVNDSGTSAPYSEAAYFTVKDNGTYYILVSVPSGGSAFGTYNLNVSVLPAATNIASTTYNSADAPQTIPSGPGLITSTITIPDNKRIGKLKVAINLSHTYMQDLDVSLTSPEGSTIGLFNDIGSTTSGARTNMNMILDDDAAAPIGVYAVVSGEVFKPTSSYRLEWLKGLQAQGTWTLTIRDDAGGDGGNLNGWSLIVEDEAPSPVGAPVTLFSTDFESNDGGFTNSGVNNEWALGTPSSVPITNAYSGTNCWKTDLTGGYNADSSQDLFSPAINLAQLSAAQPILLTWAMKYQMENANFDHAYVEVQETGGGKSRKVWEWTGPTMTATLGNPSTTIQEAAGWGLHRALISDFAGKTVQVRFHLDSDDAVQLSGLAIDDVSVKAYPSVFKSGNNLVANFLSTPGRPYQLQQITNLESSVWFDFNPQTIFAAPETGVFNFTNQISTSQKQFYRATAYP